MDFVYGPNVYLSGLDINFISPSPPVNVIAPVLTGTAQVRETLTTDIGTWTPGVPAPIYTYFYQWQASNANVLFATSNSYTIPYTHVGETIRSSVIATNATGSAVAYSNNTINVLANVPLAPTSIVASKYDINTVNIAFVPPVDDGGNTIINYNAISNTGGYANSASSSPILISGVPIGTPFTYTVDATNSIGTGPYGISNAFTLNIDITLIDSKSTTLNSNKIVITPDGKFVYVGTSGATYVYSRNLSTGILTNVFTYSSFALTDVTELAITSDGQYFYSVVTNGVSAVSTITYFSINSSTGALTSTGSINVSFNLSGIVISPDDLNFYCMTTDSGFNDFATKFDIGGSGALTNKISYAITSRIGYINRKVIISSDGINIYFGISRTVYPTYVVQFDRNTSTGALSNLVQYATGTVNLIDIILSIDNLFLYVNSGSMNSYVRDPATGNLSSFTTYSPVGSGNTSLILSTDLVLLTAPQSYNRNTTTGALTYDSSIGSFAPSAAAILSPDNLNIYCVTGTLSTVTTYTIS